MPAVMGFRGAPEVQFRGFGGGSTGLKGVATARVASARIAVGMPRVMATMIGPIPLSSRWAVTIRRCP